MEWAFSPNGRKNHLIDYQKNLNGVHYVLWFINEHLSNPSETYIITTDNASCHKVLPICAPGPAKMEKRVIKYSEEKGFHLDPTTITALKSKRG